MPQEMGLRGSFLSLDVDVVVVSNPEGRRGEGEVRWKDVGQVGAGGGEGRNSAE